jgi:hypothetical protein
MIKNSLEKLRALELEIQALETRKRMLEINRVELRESVLEQSMAYAVDGHPQPCLCQYSVPLGNVVAVVSIDEDWYEMPPGHQNRLKIEFIPTLLGGA